MNYRSGIALAIALTVGAGFSQPALAQKKGKEAAPAAQPAQWAPKLTKDEAAALKPVETAIAVKDWAAASAALAAAQPKLTSPDARFYYGQFQVNIGVGTNNAQLQSEGIDAMIASGGGDPSRALLLYKTQGGLALQAKNYAKAEPAFARWVQLAPNDPDAQLALAEVKYRQNKPAEAFPMLERAIAAKQASGAAVPEAWYRLALQSAIDAKMQPQAATLSRTLLGSYPTPQNWRNALLIYRQGTTLDNDTRLDTLRLMRASKSLDRSDEYIALADALARGRFYAEARDVINEGRSSGKITSSNADATAILNEVSGRISGDRAVLGGLEGKARADARGATALNLADAYYGHGDYAKAAEFYRLALQKGSVDANVANTRLGIALAMAGQKAPAEAAFKAVTGARQSLASYWLLWLAQRA